MIETEAELVAALESKKGTGERVSTKLKTDQRVLARVSDGIYRRPASAIRELIANAYDAGATKVVVHTDAPRFAEISVRDNGRGMSREALANLVHHIGGSAKRTSRGQDLGMVADGDLSLTPEGRRIIGKIGIGLFSVAQLTREFKIITKVEGEPYRLVADVRLLTYQEDDVDVGADDGDGPGRTLSTGIVDICSVPAEDSSSHGTEVILQRLQPAAVELLQSKELWNRLHEAEDEEAVLDQRDPPDFHVGCVRGVVDESGTNGVEGDGQDGVFDTPPRLPWSPEDAPLDKMKNMYECVRALHTRYSKPKLSHIFDEYLRMIWESALGLPLEYLDGRHPFDRPADGTFRYFALSNRKRGQAKEIVLREGETPRKRFGLNGPFGPSDTPFDVYVDGVLLRRPIRFDDLPEASKEDERKRPLLFIGKFDAPVDRFPREFAGGRQFNFESYLMWSYRVVPTEHAGVMVRISDASGTLFDETFMGYQVQEVRRLNQTVAEVFVDRGLDAALNIDRESLNFGHPHAKVLSQWVHLALRQLATTQKKVAREWRDEQRTRQGAETRGKLERVVGEEVGRASGDEPRPVMIAPTTAASVESRHVEQPGISIPREVIEPALTTGPGAAQARRRRHEEAQIVAIVQILDSYGVLEDLPPSRRTALIGALARVLGVKHDG